MRNELYHHGVKGQKWGTKKASVQTADSSRTSNSVISTSSNTIKSKKIKTKTAYEKAMTPKAKAAAKSANSSSAKISAGKLFAASLKDGTKIKAANKSADESVTTLRDSGSKGVNAVFNKVMRNVANINVKSL